MQRHERTSFEELEGKIIKNIIGKEGSDSLIFMTEDNKKYMMYHEQDCCESVYLEDVVGDLHDLIGEKIIYVDEYSNEDSIDEGLEEYSDSFTWTFYTIKTKNTTITLRWFGTSNGYYSESVDFVEIIDDEENYC